MENQPNVTNASEILPLKVKLAYGLSGYSSFITWTLFALYGLYFFTDVIGLGAAFAGAIISLGTAWDAITDPIIGSLSDNMKNPKGRRRPLIIGVAVPFCLISVLLFTDFGFNETATKFYFIAMIILYYTAQTVLDISSSALGSEMTLDYDERSTLATLKNFFAMVVGIVIAPTLVLADAIGWSATVALYMVIALICIFLLWKVTDGYERHHGGETTKFSFSDVVTIFKNKSARIVMIIFALGVFGNTINDAFETYFFIYNVELSDAQIAGAFTYLGVAAALAALVVDVLCKKISKKLAWVIAVGVEGIGMIIMITAVIKPGDLIGVYVMITLMVLGVAAVYQIPWSMIPDTIDVQQLKTGKRTDGVVFGVIAFTQKVAGAIAIALAGVLLSAIGYSGTGDPSPETLFMLKNAYGFVCGGIFLVTVAIVFAYPLSKKRHDDVIVALEAKEKGEEVNLDDFKDLI